MNANPLISVVTPVFNASEFIRETINSVLNQTYSNWELILIDDASTDGSGKICSEMSSKDSRIHFEIQPVNKGAAFCRNRATELASGKYIAFLDADDLWAPEKLEFQLRFMQENECDVSFTSYLHIDEKGNSLHKRVIAIPSLSYKKQYRNNYIGNLTGMYHAEKIGKVKSANLRKRQDWALWLEAIKKSGSPAKGINRDLAFYRIRKNSMSINKFPLVQHNYLFYRDYLGHSAPKSLLSLFRFFIEYFFVRSKFIEKTN
jgi:glycosyltransferase involved in cell wall biosynthesis